MLGHPVLANLRSYYPITETELFTPALWSLREKGFRPAVETAIGLEALIVVLCDA